MAKNNAYESIPEEVKHEYYYEMPKEIILPDAKVGEEYDYQLPMIEKYTVYGTTLGLPTNLPKGLKVSLTGRITGVPTAPAYNEVRIFRFLKAARARTKTEAMKDVRLTIRVNPAN